MYIFLLDYELKDAPLQGGKNIISHDAFANESKSCKHI